MYSSLAYKLCVCVCVCVCVCEVNIYITAVGGVYYSDKEIPYQPLASAETNGQSHRVACILL